MTGHKSLSILKRYTHIEAEKLAKKLGSFAMGTVLRIGVWRVMICTQDHRPSHVHVVSGAGRAKILLNCPDGPAVPRACSGHGCRDPAAIGS
jgi:hypothetical protein